ncbi:MAG: hypothetical protein IJC83_01520 [Oscillospiraceae bacterium]|nr:hypothetical protein [Oscillospiraceae bacterium]
MKTENGYLKNYLTQIVTALDIEPDFSGVKKEICFPNNRVVFKEETPLVTIGFEKLDFSSAGLCDFVGNTTDLDGNPYESYGKRCDISLVFSIFSPLKDGGEGVYNLASSLCDFLSFSGVVFPKNILCSEVVYNTQSRCYQMKVTALVPTLVLYEQKAEQISNIIIRSVK